MNKTQIATIIFAFFLLALMATNPSIEDHREVVFRKVQDSVNEKNISRDNYILFSKTRIKSNDKIMIVGTGIIGKVWIDDELLNDFIDIEVNELPKKDSTKSRSEITDFEREKALKKFQGEYWKNTDFYVIYFDLTYSGDYKYKFKLYSNESCKISKLSGEFKLELNNKGSFYTKSCGKITFDFNDLFNPEYKNQPTISIKSEKENCMYCYECVGCNDFINTFGDFWKIK